MASSKRKQDEKHLKMLREMAALTHNKHCFDCHQRGPTYVNMTIGSYVCTSCSGILRGLNPPHRVKSISMASFTPEEMDFLKSSGNEFCRKTWLGLYDNRSGMEPDSRDEQKVKDFMSQKYERKRFYVAPTDALKEEARHMNESPADKPTQTRPLKSLLGSNTPSLVVQNNQSPQQAPKAAGAHPPPVVAPQSKDSTPSSFPSPGQTSQSSQSSGSATVDLLGELGGDPFGSSAPAPAPAPVNLGSGSGTGGGFADFSSFNQFPPPTQPNPVFPTASNPLVPMSSSASSNGASLSGITSAPPPTAMNTSVPTGDNKYSNLADLFSSPVPDQTINTSSGTSVNWGGGSSGGVAGGGGSSTTGINWGGGSSGINSSSSSSGTDAGINWSNTSSSGGGGIGGGAGSGGINWGGNLNTTSASIPNSSFPASAGGDFLYPGKPGNPFFSELGANPFGGGGTTVQTQSTIGGANPFASAQPMFGQTASSGFGQPVSATGGFGAQPTGTSFGQPGASSGGFGHPAPSTGGFGHSAPSAGGFGAGGFGQPVSTAGFGQPSGAFGQPPSTGAFSQPATSMSNFGQPTQNAAGGFGQFGGTPQPSGGFGQFGVQNGGFGGGQGQFDNKSSSGGFGQQGFSTPASGGWGQPATSHAANPFMSAAQTPIQPKSGSTNPFL